MKHALKNLILLILGGLILLLAGCQQGFKYENFTDLDQKGPEVFNADLKTCWTYGSTNSKRSEGSQGSGERLILKRNLFLSCMNDRQWTLNNT